jgi:hypothetical protein
MRSIIRSLSILLAVPALTWGSQVLNIPASSGGSGSSFGLAITTGNSSGYTGIVIETNTVNITVVFDSNTINVTKINGTTIYATPKPSSVTLQGNTNVDLLNSSQTITASKIFTSSTTLLSGAANLPIVNIGTTTLILGATAQVSVISVSTQTANLFGVGNSTSNYVLSVSTNGSVIIIASTTLQLTPPIPGELFSIVASTGGYLAGPGGNNQTLFHGVSATGVSGTFLIDTYGAGALGLNASLFKFRKADGDPQHPGALGDSDTIGYLSWDGYNGTNFTDGLGAAYIWAQADGAWSSTANGTKLNLVITGKTQQTTYGLDIGDFGNASIGPQASVLSNTQFNIVSSTTNLYELRVGTGTSSSQWHVAVSTSGHFITNGSSVTISNCGASPLLSEGNDISGRIRTGASVSSCQVNFTHSYNSVPQCFAAGDSAANPVSYVTDAAGGFTVGFTGTISNDFFSYFCVFANNNFGQPGI